MAIGMNEWRDILFKWAPLLISIIGLMISISAYLQSGKASRLSQKAYVSHEAELYNRQEFISAVATDAPVLRIFFGFKVTNFGNTPAKNLQYTFTYTIPATTQLVIGEGTSIRRLDIAPKQSRTLEVTLTFSNAEGSNTLNHFFQTKLEGKVSYDDVFGGTETIPICYVMLANAIDARTSNCPAPIDIFPK